MPQGGQQLTRGDLDVILVFIVGQGLLLFHGSHTDLSYKSTKFHHRKHTKWIKNDRNSTPNYLHTSALDWEVLKFLDEKKIVTYSSKSNDVHILKSQIIVTLYSR